MIDAAALLDTEDPAITVPVRLAPLAAFLVEYAAKEIAQRGGTRSALRDLPELQAILRPAAASARGRGRSTMEPQARAEEITTAQAAEVLGVSDRCVRLHARSGRLIARKAGRDWLIDADSARDYTQWGEQLTVTTEGAREAAAAARRDIDQAEADILTGKRSVTAAAMHKLTDTWRHADLTAEAARRQAEQEGREARTRGLEAIGGEVDTLAVSPQPDGLADALRDIAEACARVRSLAAAHDADVAELVGAATALAVEPAAPAGPRKTSSFVALKGRDSISHKAVTVSPVGFRISTAIQHAVTGDVDRAVAEVQTVTTAAQSKRPRYLLRNEAGMLLSYGAELNGGLKAQVRSGALTVLSEHDIDLYMRGELG